MAYERPLTPVIVGDYDYEMTTSPVASRPPEALAPQQHHQQPQPQQPMFAMPAQCHWPSWDPHRPPVNAPASRKRAFPEKDIGVPLKRAALQEQQQWR